MKRILAFSIASLPCFVFADSLDNEQALQIFKGHSDDVAMVSSMAANCSRPLDEGLFNLAADTCLSFMKAFNNLYPELKPAVDYSSESHEAGLTDFCTQDDEIKSVCMDMGEIMGAYDKTKRAIRLGALQ